MVNPRFSTNLLCLCAASRIFRADIKLSALPILVAAFLFELALASGAAASSPNVAPSPSTSPGRNRQPAEADPCADILKRLQAVTAWDIEVTQAKSLSVSGGGGAISNTPSITGYAIDKKSDFVYSYRLKVTGNCTSPTAEPDDWPCMPRVSAESPGQLEVARNDLVDGWGIDRAEADCWCDARQESTYSTQNSLNTAPGIIYLDGLTPTTRVLGGLGIDTSVCPPRAFGSLQSYPEFPTHQVVTECQSCADNGHAAGCRVVTENDFSYSTNGFARIGFGPDEPQDWGLRDARVRLENDHLVVRGHGTFTRASTPCIGNPIYCGLAYVQICSQTRVPGVETLYVSVVMREHRSTLKIHSVEFTQNIQVGQPIELLKADLVGDGSPPVPLVAGKPAVMRVYFEQANEAARYTLDVSGRMVASRTGSLDPPCSTEDQRRQTNACSSQDFYFTPPEGPWSVTLSLKDGDGVEQESHVLNLISKKSTYLALKAVTVCDSKDASGNWNCAHESTLQLLVGLLKKIIPTDVVFVVPTEHYVRGRVVPDVNGDADSDDCLDANGNGINDLGDLCEPDKWWDLVVDAIEELYRAHEPPPTPGVDVYYYGMVRPAAAGFAGLAVMSGRAAASMTSVHVSGFELAPFAVAHETAHMLGRRHTNTDEPRLQGDSPGCWLGESENPTWPYADNWLSSGAPPGVFEIGFDVQAHRALDPLRAFDVMGYCAGNNWVSPHTALGLMEALPPQAATQREVAPRRETGSFWRVSGTIEAGAATINPIFTIETLSSTEPGNGTHRIEVSDAVGNELFVRFFTPTTSHISPTPGEQVHEGIPFFSELIPVQASAAHILIQGSPGGTLAELELGGITPTVNIAFPAGGENLQGPEIVGWTVTDADSANHMFQVQYSADGGATWRSLTSAESGLSLVVNFADLPGSANQSLIRVLASDGVNTGVAVSNSFSVAKKQPSAKILSPSSGDGFDSGTLVLLQAMAFDADDGAIDDASLQWTSDANGLLGNGNDVSVYHLSPGSHMITLTATDSDGNTATDQVHIFVFDEPTPDPDFDGDVDLADFGPIHGCLAGPRSTPSAPACRAFDFDADGDVDEVDFAVFQNCASGKDAPADPDCSR